MTRATVTRKRSLMRLLLITWSKRDFLRRQTCLVLTNVGRQDRVQRALVTTVAAPRRTSSFIALRPVAVPASRPGRSLPRSIYNLGLFNRSFVSRLARLADAALADREAVSLSRPAGIGSCRSQQDPACRLKMNVRSWLTIFVARDGEKSRD